MNNYDQYDQESQALLKRAKPLSFEQVMGNRQQDFFKSPNNGSSSDYLSPFAKQFEFKSLTSKEIADNYFNSIKPVQKSNITVYQEPETKTDVILKEIKVYRDNDPTKGFQEQGDLLLYNIIAYISTEQTKLKDLYLKSENKVGDKEILLFLEDNTNDFSEQYLYARFGKSVKKEHLLTADQQDNLLKLVPDFSSEMLQELIQTGQVKASNTITGAITKGMLYIVSLIGLPGKAIGWLCDEIGDVISNYLTIPETVWDSKGEDYFLKKENLLKDLQIDTSLISTVPDSLKKQPQYSWFNSFLLPQNTALFVAQPLNVIEELVNKYNLQVQNTLDSFFEKDKEQTNANTDKTSDIDMFALSEQIAFLCGIWNGLVDFIAGTFKFLAMTLSAQYDLATNHQEIMEELDELYANIKKIKFTDVLIPAVTTYFQVLSEINKFFTSKNPSDYNFDRIAYFTGFGLASIATAFIPFTQLVKVSRITKVSKLIPEEFLTGLSQVKGGAVNGIKPMLALFRELSKVFAKGADEIKAFFQRIKKAIVEWFLKNKKLFQTRKLLKELESYTSTRAKFHDLVLVEKLWKSKITSKKLFPNNLRSLYFKYLDTYPALKKGFNQAEFKTIIKKKGKLVEEVEEFSLSGKKSRLLNEFGDPPKLPPNTINVLDDWQNFEKFVEGAVDFVGYERRYDSEIKYIFNFLKNHMNKGDEFIIETKNIFKTCGSCKREFVMLENYLRTHGKKIKIILFSDENIEGTRKLKEKLKIK